MKGLKENLEKLKCHPSLFGRKYQLERRGSHRTLNEHILRKIYLEDYRTIRKIADYFGVSSFKISYYLRKYGIRKVERWERYGLKHFRLEQKEYLFGSLLGDDSLKMGENRKYPFLSVAHSIDQRKYVQWKHTLWKQITPGGIKENVPIKVHSKIYYSDRFTTAAHPDFTGFFKMFYSDGRKIVNEKVLKRLAPFSIAVWYMDDGYYDNYRGRVRLSTNSFTYEENIAIKNYFKEMWDISSNIGKSDSGTHYIWFNTKNTIEFFNIIKNYILPSFDYKIDLKRKLRWRPFSKRELRYIKENYNIEHPRLIAHKLGRSPQSIFNIAHKLGVTQPRGGVKRYERYM